jgi:K+/H+ antiporter YhaU regulatory subunit KhtT
MTAMTEDIKVQELYGIGKKYDVGCSRGQRISVVIRKDGRRELYSFETDAEEPTSVIELSDEQARKLGAVLSGTYFSG